MSKDEVWTFGSEYERVSNIIGRIRSKEKEVEGTMKIIKGFFENEVKWHFRKEEKGLIPILRKVIGEERSVIDKTLASHQEFRKCTKGFYVR